MEFACGVFGAKVVLVLGHAACGAVKGAITMLFSVISLGYWCASNRRSPPQNLMVRSPASAGYVHAVARANVVLGIGEILRQKILKRREQLKSQAQ